MYSSPQTQLSTDALKKYITVSVQINASYLELYLKISSFATTDVEAVNIKRSFAGRFFYFAKY